MAWEWYETKKGLSLRTTLFNFDFEAKDKTLFLLRHRSIHCGCGVASFESSFKHDIKFLMVNK